VYVCMRVCERERAIDRAYMRVFCVNVCTDCVMCGYVHVYVCVCLCVCVRVFVCMCLHVCVSLCVRVSVFVRVHRTRACCSSKTNHVTQRYQLHP